jgi:hypothetical protein
MTTRAPYGEEHQIGEQTEEEHHMKEHHSTHKGATLYGYSCCVEEGMDKGKVDEGKHRW